MKLSDDDAFAEKVIKLADVLHQTYAIEDLDVMVEFITKPYKIENDNLKLRNAILEKITDVAFDLANMFLPQPAPTGRLYEYVDRIQELEKELDGTAQ